ncbi:hypothetical protein TSMEX_002696 [Taenia solium]|eukprot:TsM_001082500 transcript=TsM_001082500 gene=TsM_001082500
MSYIFHYPIYSIAKTEVVILVTGIDGVARVLRVVSPNTIVTGVERKVPSDSEKLRNQDIDFIKTSGFVQTAFRSSRNSDQVTGNFIISRSFMHMLPPLPVVPIKALINRTPPRLVVACNAITIAHSVETTFKVPSEMNSAGGSAGLNTVSGTSGQYEALIRERAHEAAIFGTGHSQPLDTLCLGARPSDDSGSGGDGGQKLVPTTQVVKEIIHPRCSTDEVVALPACICHASNPDLLRGQFIPLKKNKTLAYREWAARLNDLANARRQSRQSVTSQ